LTRKYKIHDTKAKEYGKNIKYFDLRIPLPTKKYMNGFEFEKRSKSLRSSGGTVLRGGGAHVNPFKRFIN
jgi:hypothetical protein